MVRKTEIHEMESLVYALYLEDAQTVAVPAAEDIAEPAKYYTFCNTRWASRIDCFYVLKTWTAAVYRVFRCVHQ